jgi:Fe-S-cluster-containing hydrogenase component 2
MVVNNDKCIGCGTCVDICPVNAISLQDGKAVINQEKCVNCGACAGACPVNAIE